MGVIIEPVREQDSEVWAAMRRELGPEWFTSDFDRVIGEYFECGTIDNLRHIVLLARNETGEAAGFAEVSLRDFAEGCESSPVGYLEGWFVAAHARKAGVGRALVAAGEDWARAQGCTEFASDAEIDNEASRLAHRALGFEEVVSITCFRKPLGRIG